jgi:uncharacterized membrane protein
MNRYVTVGLGVLAGAALFEAALIPGIVIGGAAVLAPRYLPRLGWLLPNASRLARPRRGPGVAPPLGQNDTPRISLPAGLRIKQAVGKTITFRTFATVMDFTTNYVVIGDAATAAALTAFGFVIGPFGYLGHEMLWDYYSAPRQRRPGLPVTTNAAVPIGRGSNAEVEPA